MKLFFALCVLVQLSIFLGCSPSVQRSTNARHAIDEENDAEIRKVFTEGELKNTIKSDDLSWMIILSAGGRTPSSLDTWVTSVVVGKHETRFVKLRKNGKGSPLIVEDDFTIPPKEQALELALASLGAAPPDFWFDQEPTLEQFKKARFFYTYGGREMTVSAKNDGVWSFCLGKKGEIVIESVVFTQ